MDLEKRVDNLEIKVKELEMGLHDSLHEIKLDLQEKYIIIKDKCQ